MRIEPPGAVVEEADVEIVRFTGEGIGLGIGSRVGEQVPEGGVGVAVDDVAALVREESNRSETVGVVEPLLRRSDNGEQVVAADVECEEDTRTVGLAADVAQRSGSIDEEMLHFGRASRRRDFGSDAVAIRVVGVRDDRSIGLLHSDEAVLEIRTG